MNVDSFVATNVLSPASAVQNNALSFIIEAQLGTPYLKHFFCRACTLQPLPLSPIDALPFEHST